MNNKILPIAHGTIFESHIRSDNKQPFIYHFGHTTGHRISNFHENLELIYFTHGEGHVEYNDHRHPVRENDLIVVNSFAIHQIVSTTPINFFCLIIDNSFCKYHDIDISSLQFNEHVNDPQLTTLFRRLLRELSSQNPFRDTAFKAAVLDILLLLCRSYSKPQGVRSPNVKASQACAYSAIEYIKKHISEKMTVEEIASAVGLSQYYFMREFKRFTGCTLTNYIKLIRCEYAKELLMTRKYKIKEIAALCGFDNESYFTNIFKKHTGVCPSDYAKDTGIL